MKYFFDTEFIEYPNTIDLISIGMVSDDGAEYYAVSSEYDFKKASPWVVQNVIKPIHNEMGISKQIPIQTFHHQYGKSIAQIRQEILDFVCYPKYPDGNPEFWAYYSAYDWCVFCWIFGRMIDLPKGFPMYCKDLKQLYDHYKMTKKPKDPVGEHNALVDARWNRELYRYIQDYHG
jgi:hypothetical protein